MARVRYVFLSPQSCPFLGLLFSKKLYFYKRPDTSTDVRDFEMQSWQKLGSISHGRRAPDGIVLDSKSNAICRWNFENLLKEVGLLMYTLTFYSFCHLTKDKCKIASIKKGKIFWKKYCKKITFKNVRICSSLL